MPSAKTKRENVGFPESVREAAFKLIDAGKGFDGGFWRNHSKSAKKCGYKEWGDVPEEIRNCVNQIGRNASRKGKERMGRKKMNGGNVDMFSPNELDDFWNETRAIPRDTPPEKLRQIRVHITKRAGFDPNRILLGVESRMEK